MGCISFIYCLKELLELKEKQDKNIRKLKKQLKLYIKRVEDYEGNCATLTVTQFIFCES